MDIPDVYRTCHACQNEFSAKEHDTGLVLNDSHFLCKNCCTSKQSIEIMEWAKQNTEGKIRLEPIHVWLLRNNK